MSETPAVAIPPQLEPALPPVYSWCVIDIETSNSDPADAEFYMRYHWSPSRQWKATTIGERFKQALEKRDEKLALLDSSPVICVGLKSDTELRCLHCMRVDTPHLVNGGLVEGFPTQREMLLALRVVLDTFADADTVVAGHNILRFDLPKLRSAFVTERCAMPQLLQVRDPLVFDTMGAYHKRFSIKSSDVMVGVGTVCEAFGLPHHKGELDGEQIPQLFEQGQFDHILEYCLKDAVLEAQLFELMTSQGTDLL